MVAEDLAKGTLVELRRRAWHMRPLTFMIALRSGYSFSEREARLVELLDSRHPFCKGGKTRASVKRGR
jgi:hypothetical protein